jgi:adenosylmethionine-8-amino-7-oxononanoate aminotransferase
VLDIYEAEDLIPRGRELEQPLADALATLEDHPAVTGVRAGLGFLAAVGLTPDVDAGAFARRARDGGVLVRPLLSGIAVSPPLISEPEHLELLAGALTAAL